MSKFSDYLASQITPQMTLLEKFNLMIKFLQENNYISVFYSQENYNVQTESYQKEKVNLNGFTLHIGDCIVFSNGYYAFVETIGVNTFTIGNVLYFQGEQGVSIVGATISSGHLILTLSDNENIDAGNLKGVSNFSINESNHLIVNYQDGTSQDLGDIFNGNVNITGNLSATGTISAPTITATDVNPTNIGATYIQTVSFKATDNAQIFEKIMDHDLHLRFIEGDGTINELTGFTSVFCKWSLSGSHIMFVLAGSFASGTEVPSVHDIVTFEIPNWIYNKIYPVWSTYIEDKVVSCKATNWSAQEVDMALMKESGVIKIRLLGAPTTFTALRSFRVQFDLIIDN